jgi:hypothetical protein
VRTTARVQNDDTSQGAAAETSPSVVATKLSVLLDRLPPDALVPVGWLRVELAAERVAAEATIPEMLTPAEFSELFRPKRTAEWARDRCNEQRFPGAIRRGRQWLIPSASLVDGPLPVVRHSRSNGSAPDASEAVHSSHRPARPSKHARRRY